MLKQAKALKTFAVFFLLPMVVNMAMEMALGPENRELIREEGVAAFMEEKFRGIAMFYAIMAAFGSALFLRGWKFEKLGVASTLLGFLFEFTFMMPDWAQEVLALQFSVRLLFTVAITAFYWWILWGAPAWLIERKTFGQVLS